jgi:type II secretory pathway pseudopilin PulG
MKSAPDPSERQAARVSAGDGYAMAALLVGLSIMAVMMTVAMPVWKQMAQREKEAELVFRGQQYARAVGLFQRKNGPGTLPPSIDVLIEQRFLRRKYKDPITNDDFQPLLAGQAVFGGQQPAGTPSTAAARGVGSSTTQPLPSGVGSGRANVASATGGVGGTPGRGASGGIMGVASKSTEQSIRLYQGRNHYNEWAFLYVAQVQAPGAAGAGGVPGAGGQRSGQRGIDGAGGVGRSGSGDRGGRSPGGPGGRGPFGPGGAGGPVGPGPQAPRGR